MAVEHEQSEVISLVTVVTTGASVWVLVLHGHIEVGVVSVGLDIRLAVE